MHRYSNHYSLPIQNPLHPFRSNNRQHFHSLPPLPRLARRAETPRHERRIQQPNLHQHTRLIPVDILPGELARAETGRHHKHNLHVAVRGRYPRQQPGYLLGMPERQQDLVDDAVRPHGARKQADTARITTPDHHLHDIGGVSLRVGVTARIEEQIPPVLLPDCLDVGRLPAPAGPAEPALKTIQRAAPGDARAEPVVGVARVLCEAGFGLRVEEEVASMPLSAGVGAVVVPEGGVLGLHTDDGVSLPGLEIILPLVQQVQQILAISFDIFVSTWEWQILHLEPFALEARDDAWVEIMRVGRYIETSRGYVPFILAPVGAGETGRLERCRAGAAAATPSGEMLAQLAVY
ncbi:hypothetical protein GB937_003196 [Aspergillus fischeri]|nr:hypothetical protein GB937_003196 [Aspergillus fischeri]